MSNPIVSDEEGVPLDPSLEVQQETAVVPIRARDIPQRIRSAAAIARREKAKATLEKIAAGTPPAIAIKKSGLTAREFFSLLRKSPSLDRAYELSRQAGAQVLADQGLALAAHLSRDPEASPSQVMSLKLRLDYLRWYIGKLYPKTFSDRLAGEGSGSGKSVTVVVVMDDRKPAAD